MCSNSWTPFFKYQYRTLAKHPLNDAAVARGGDNILLALWLYDLTGQNYLLELCRRLREQTLDWPNYFPHVPQRPAPEPQHCAGRASKKRSMRKKASLWRANTAPISARSTYQTNGENIAVGLRTPGAINLFKSGFKEQGGFRLAGKS